MIKISKMTDYAVVILATLARSDGAVMTASGVSSRSGLPEPTVSKILKTLARGHLLESTRGASGGYKLADSPQKISVAAIIDTVDGPVSLTSCVDGNPESCGYESKCPVKGRWNGVNRAVRAALTNVTLADMICTENTLITTKRDLDEQHL